MKLVPLVLAVAASAVLATTGISAPRDTSFPGGSYFAIICSFSHRNNDDPIVHPGSPGRSHNHTYIGNTSVHAFSTPASLRGGKTTCELPGDLVEHRGRRREIEHRKLRPCERLA